MWPADTSVPSENREAAAGRLSATGVWERALELLGDCRGSVILDAPAGAGGLSAEIRKRGARVVSLDLAETAGSHPDSVRADLNAGLPFADRFFDKAVCLEGIEHIENPSFLLREFARVLRPGGSLVLSTPNTVNLRSRLKFLLRGDLFWFDRASAGRYGHITPLFPWQIESLCDRLGLRVTAREVSREMPLFRPLAGAVSLVLRCIGRPTGNNDRRLLCGEIALYRLQTPDRE